MTQPVPTAVERPLVTIGVPVFNGEQYLREALDSALAQDYDPLEIVIADNASCDDTPNICRAYAQRDRRVRYLRNPENLGGTQNFARVLAEARGKYFTWLAHDDVLASTGYIRATVEVLEQNPDVVLCGSSMNVLEFDGPGTSSPALLEPIYPDRDWQQARRRFFRCPFDSLIYFAIYGVFRREVLLTVPLTERWYRGRRVSLDMENPILAALATRGRIVALPELLRSFRHHASSTWHVDQDRLSGLDRFVLGLGMKGRILRIALGGSLPLGQKFGLVGTALANFFRHVVSAPTDYKSQIKQLKKEIRMLRLTCEERLELINRLHADCLARGQALETLQQQLKAA